MRAINVFFWARVRESELEITSDQYKCTALFLWLSLDVAAFNQVRFLVPNLR